MRRYKKLSYVLIFITLSLCFCGKFLFTVSNINTLFDINKDNFFDSANLKTHSTSEEFNKEWISNPSFDNPTNSWFKLSGGDPTDVNASIKSGQGNFEILGEKRTFSLVETPPIGSNWLAIPNPDFPQGPSSNFSDSEGLKVYHFFDDENANQNPSVHWDRNITTSVDMSDYVIKSASIQVVVNATVDLDVDCPGDDLDQQESYDYVRFYVLVSDLPKGKVYEMAYLQPTDLGQGNPPGDDTLPNSYLIAYPEDDLIYFLTSVLSTNYFNFTITLGIRIYTADNFGTYDNDEFHELLIKSVNLTFSYEKKIDQLTYISWNQIGDKVTGDNIEITSAILNFEYKIDQIWPETRSLNSELRIFINDFLYERKIRLISFNTSFQEIGLDGFDVTALILKEVNISVSFQIFLADEFVLDKKITISIDNVSLLISYEDISPSYTLIMIILIGSFVIIAILSSLSLRTHVLIPRKKKRDFNLQSRIQKFKDSINIQAILIVQNNSGIPIFYKSYSMLKKEKQVLFPGFIQALTAMAKEITDEKDNKYYSEASAAPYDIKELLEFDFKYFNCLVSDKNNIRIILILKEKASQRLKQKIIDLTSSLNLKISDQLEEFDGSLDNFNQIIPSVLSEHLKLFYKEPFKLCSDRINISKLKRENNIPKIEMRIINVIHSISKDNHHFYLEQLVNIISEENKDLIFDAINSLIYKHIIIPSLN